MSEESLNEEGNLFVKKYVCEIVMTNLNWFNILV